MTRRIFAVAIASAACLSASPSFAQDAAPATTQEAPASPAPASDKPATPAPPPAKAPPAWQKPIRFTGMLGAINLPRLLALEVMVRFAKPDEPAFDRWAIGAAVEYLPPGLIHFGDNNDFSWFQVGPEVRFSPWRWFYAGARIGYQFSRDDSKLFGSSISYVTTSGIVSPKIGAIYTFPNGLTLASDLGATIPLAPGTTLTSEGQSDSNARAAAKTFGMFVMPTLTLRVGWTI